MRRLIYLAVTLSVVSCSAQEYLNYPFMLHRSLGGSTADFISSESPNIMETSAMDISRFGEFTTLLVYQGNSTAPEKSSTIQNDDTLVSLNTVSPGFIRTHDGTIRFGLRQDTAGGYVWKGEDGSYVFVKLANNVLEYEHVVGEFKVYCIKKWNDEGILIYHYLANNYHATKVDIRYLTQDHNKAIIIYDFGQAKIQIHYVEDVFSEAFLIHERDGVTTLNSMRQVYEEYSKLLE